MSIHPVKIFFVFFLLLSNHIFAQKNDISFNAITSKSGLSSNNVNVILKDKNGLMWFGTEDGLNKYDGTNFTVYRHSTKDSTSLPANEVTALYEDNNGNLWIGTNGGYVSIYNRKRDSFINFFFSPQASLMNSAIKVITGNAYGEIWVAHFSGLMVIKPDQSNLLKSKLIQFVSKSIVLKEVQSIYEDHEKNMWVGTKNGLFKYNRKGYFKAFRHEVSNTEGLIGNSVKAITEDLDHHLWVGTSNGLSMMTEKGAFKNYPAGSGNALISNTIYTLAADRQGKLWIGTEEGLSILDIKKQQFHSYLPNSRNKNSLTSKAIRCVYQDRAGITWLGTFQGGINKYDKNLSTFNLKQSNPFDEHGLAAPIVTSFEKSLQKGKVYVATDGGGLHLFDTRTGLFDHVGFGSDKNYSKGLSILALEMSRGNQLLIGTYSSGLYRLNLNNGESEHYTSGSDDRHLSDNSIFCIKEDRKGNIWIGTNGGGLNVLDLKTKKIKKFVKNSDTSSVLKLPLNGFIRAIEETKDGKLWIASHGTGLAVLDPETQKSIIYNRYNSDLPSSTVLSLLVDHQDNVWIGTMGGGLTLFDQKRKTFTSFSEEQGLANSVVYKIIEDQKGFIWCSTNVGISRFDLSTKKIKNYNSYNGVQNSNFALGSGLLMDDGTVFFGGLDGFNYFNPANLNTNKNIPPVILTDLKIANKSVIPSEGAPIKEQISIAKEIEVDYKESFSVSFVALNYTTSQQNQYSYKLEGLDKDWNYVGTSKTASYTSLSPGKYIFKVRASNNDGLWNKEGTAVTIYVKPPFWMTDYAYFLYVILFFGSMFYLRYRGIKKLENKFAVEREKIRVKQERDEAERLHELDTSKIKFLTNISHEFRTPIALIMGPVDNLLNKEKEEAARGQLNMVKRNSKRLLNLVNQLLDFRKMEEHELKLDLQSGEIIAFIKEVMDSFLDYAERKNINLEFDAAVTQFYSRFDHDKIERILFNLLSNAFKFTPQGGNITVSLELASIATEKETVNLTIKVQDTGIGIPDNEKDKIFEHFYQHETTASILNQGTGIGLAITKEFVKLHGGKISVESKVGEGTTFIIDLPMPSEYETVENAEKAIETTEETALEKQEANLGRPSVLLVEDNEDFRTYLRDNLREFYHVFEAQNGKEGWQIALAQHPQLIVSDITMPVMNGIELCQKLKADKRTAHIPVILLTALTKEEEQIKGLETGANDYMSKPFNFEILNVKIRNLLDLNQSLKNTYSKQIKVLTSEISIESEDEKLMKKIADYIERNISDSKLTVEDLSKHVGMSRSSLYHRLLEITGETPIEYIRTIKLEKAALLLEKSDLNVAQVSYAVGFATPNYFAKSFKAKFDILPSDFRNIKKKN